MSIYSFSQIWVYQQCPKKYQYQYIDKIEKEFKSSPDLILWTSVHWWLERLYQQINIFKLPTKQEFLNKFHELWNLSIQESWEKLLYKWDQTAEDYIRRWEHYLSDYYDTYHPFDWIKVIWTELNLTFYLNKDDNKQLFRWVIDRLDKQWDTYIINDYKTNKNLPPEDKDNYREQLTLYGLWVKQKYGKYLKNIKAKLHYLHFSQLDEWEINDDTLNPIIEKYSNLINEIDGAKAKYAESFNTDKQAFPTKSNNLCKFCEYKNLCPLFTHMNYEDEVISWWVLWETTIKKLIDEYVKISKQANELDKEKNSIKDILIEYTKEKNVEQLFWNESILWVSKSTTYTPKDKENFKNYLIKEWLYEKATDITNNKINELIKDWNLTTDTINKYLDWKDVWRLTPKKDN